jgi:ribose transport system substrate-binding protein
VGIALLIAALFALVAAGCGSGSDESSTSSGGSSSGSATSGSSSSSKKYVIGVSNTVVGNGWREEMICSIKAQALASGKVSEVKVSNQNGGAPEQIAAIRNLISAGADAIIVDPADASALDSVIAQADKQGVKVFAVDQAVTAPQAYNVTNDQVAYGRLGMDWLAKQLNGKGNVIELRGAAGAPADNDRQKGIDQALKKYPGIKVVKQVYTGWQFADAGKQALDILQSGTPVDGVWTSGVDYTVVNAFKTAGKPVAPIVGADNNKFLDDMLNEKGFDGAAVTNPATVGGVATALAVKALDGEQVDKDTLQTPQVWDKSNESEWKQYYDPKLPPTYSSQMQVKPYTTYTNEQLTKCQGP